MFDRNKKSLTELIRIHAAAVVDERLKGQICGDVMKAQRDAITEMHNLDMTTINSDETIQRFNELHVACDDVWIAHLDALNYSYKTEQDVLQRLSDIG